MRIKSIISVIFLLSIMCLYANNQDGYNIVNNIKTSFDPEIKYATYQLSNDKNNIIQQTSHVVTSAHSSNYVSSYSSYLHDPKSFWNAYKYPILITTIIGSYSVILFLLLKGQCYLTSKKRWTSWPKNMTFQQMLEISQQDLAEELLIEIKQKYNNTNQTDIVSPLITFLNEIEKEKATILFYVNLYSFLKSTYLINLFPISHAPFEQTKEMLERVTYLKNIFLSWATNVPLSQVKKKIIHPEPVLLI